MENFRITYTAEQGTGRQARVIQAPTLSKALDTLGPVQTVHTVTTQCHGYKKHDGGSRCKSWCHGRLCPRHDPESSQYAWFRSDPVRRQA